MSSARNRAARSIVQRRHPAARGDHRDFGRARQIGGRLHRTLHRAIAVDVGIDDRGHAPHPRRSAWVTISVVGPALGRHTPVARVDPTARHGRERPWPRRGQDRGFRPRPVPRITRCTPLSSQASMVAISRMPPPSCATAAPGSGLGHASTAARSPARRQRRRSDPPDAAIRTRKSTKPIACAARELVIEHGGFLHVAAQKAHGLAVLEVDGRVERAMGLAVARSKCLRRFGRGTDWRL